MKFCWEELIRNMISHWKYNLLIVLELVTCVLMAFIVLYNLDVLTLRANSYVSNISDRRFYTLSVEDSARESISKSYQLAIQAGRLSKEIEESENWNAYTYTISSFGLPYNESGEKAVPEIFEQGYEEGMLNDVNPNLQVLKAYSCSPQVFSAFGIELSEGRMFIDDEYITFEKDGEKTAVILGSAYRDYYEIGDVILGQGNTYNKELHVVGFLAEGSLFASPENLGMTTLDRYIIYPLTKEIVLKDGSSIVDPFGFYRFILFDGVLSVKDPAIDTQKEINKLANEFGFTQIQCTQWGGTYMESTQIVSQRNVYLLLGLSILLCGLASVSIAHVLLRKTEKNMPTYAVYMITGISPFSIMMTIVIESLIFGLVAIMPAIILSNIQFGVLVVPIENLVFVSLPITLVSLFPAIRLVSKIHLDQLSRRKSE